MKEKRENSSSSDRRNKNRLKISLWKNKKEIVNAVFSDKNWKEQKFNDVESDIPSSLMYKNIQEQIQHIEAKKLGKKRIYRLVQYSAAACALFLSMIFLLKDTIHIDTSHIQAIDITLPESLKLNRWVVEENNSTSLRQIVLPDGSTVKLYAHSRIRYVNHFTATDRDIYLHGKAYFNVKKDPSKPFSVYGNQMKTTALGTSFTVDADANSKSTRITLHTGKVAITSVIKSFKKILLQAAGEKLFFDDHHQLIAHHKIQGKKINSAASIENLGQIQRFDNVEFKLVMQALEKMYKAKISFDDKAIQYIRYTGTVDVEKESIEDVLNIICLINDLRWDYTSEGVYTIY